MVIGAQDRVAAVDQRHLDAKLVEDAGEFIGDIAAAGDDDGLRQRVEVEDLVRGDAELGPRQIGHERARAGRDQDLVGGDRRLAQPDRMRVEQFGVAVVQRDVMARQRRLVDAVQPVDLGQDIVAQRRPVEAPVAERPAEAARVDQVLGEVTAIDQQLLRHAAADDAGTADAVLLGDGDARAVARRDPRGADPARAGADDEEVVVEAGHGAQVDTPCAPGGKRE